MGQNVKILRTRIKSVDSTLHLTKAMGLVASSKVRKANENMYNSRKYVDSLKNIIALLSSSTECKKSIYFNPLNVNKTRIIIVAGDRGMAGGYNSNVLRLISNYKNCEFIPVGKRACDRFSMPVKSSERFYLEDAWKIANEQCKDYLNGKFDKLIVISTKYESAMEQTPIVTTLLPLMTEEKDNLTTIFEPSEKEILEKFIPEYIAGMVISLVRESFACEATARRTAMDSASKNATEMIDKLTLEYNRARQGAITQEITEIVAGSGT